MSIPILLGTMISFAKLRSCNRKSEPSRRAGMGEVGTVLIARAILYPFVTEPFQLQVS
jgi:hypothetical protein